MRIALFVGLLASFAGFRCSTESGTLEGNRSSEADCSDSTYCDIDDEICWDSTFCGGEEGCQDEGDDSCHQDCTESETCGGGEDCTYVGSDTWLCIG